MLNNNRIFGGKCVFICGAHILKLINIQRYKYSKKKVGYDEKTESVYDCAG